MLRDDPDTQTGQYDRAEDEAGFALSLDSTSLEVREVYDNIRAARARVAARAAGVEIGMGEVAAAATGDSIAIGVEAVETMWLTTMTTLGQQIRETVRDSLMEGSEAASQLTFQARIFMAAGDFPDALELLDSVVVVYPQTQEAWDQLLRAHMALGHLEETPLVVERWNAAGAPGAPGAEGLTRLRTAIQSQGAQGYWTWRRDYLLGQQEAGNDIVLTDLAAAYAAVGEPDRAYELLGEALEAGESRLYAVPNDPVWEPLAGDARFRNVFGGDQAEAPESVAQKSVRTKGPREAEAPSLLQEWTHELPAPQIPGPRHRPGPGSRTRCLGSPRRSGGGGLQHGSREAP